VNRPRGPGAPLDPETAARLRQILDPRASAPAAPVRRPEGPPVAVLEVRYRLLIGSSDVRPIVVVQERLVEPGKKPAAWSPARVTEKGLARYPGEADQEILRALAGLMASTASPG